MATVDLGFPPADLPGPRPSPGNVAGAPPSFHVLAKPTGAICNLDCSYCFFLSKEELYPGSEFRMSQDLLTQYLRQLLESHAGPEVTVAWQGGEPTMMGLDFFRRAVKLVAELADAYPRAKAPPAIGKTGIFVLMSVSIHSSVWAAKFGLSPHRNHPKPPPDSFGRLRIWTRGID